LLTESLIREHTNLNKGILIGYSGGPDSTALVHLLSSLKAYQELDVKAIHINHNLSKHSAMWENHCIETCSKLNINLITESIEIKVHGGGLESASRKARYRVFEKILNAGDQLLLGHHGDDVAETLFMRLLRGTGPDGMEGPKLQRSLGKGVLIRPFLEISKKQILDYLNINSIDYIEDDSNLSNDFDRNYLRNEIFPMLERKWNNFPNRINNFSKIIKDRNNSYSYLMHEKYNDLITNSIDLKKLRELSNPVISDVLRYSIKKCNIAAPNSKIIEEIIKTFVNSSPGPKSKVEWSRSDKEEASGQITYTNGHILISKR
jgi:tRNA(Ile)-lysidine synthase